jgi:hypothetical protein
MNESGVILFSPVNWAQIIISSMGLNRNEAQTSVTPTGTKSAKFHNIVSLSVVIY